jgi:hypothetical protein
MVVWHGFGSSCVTAVSRKSVRDCSGADVDEVEAAHRLSYRSPLGEMNLFHVPGGLQTRSKLCCASWGLSPRTSQR